MGITGDLITDILIYLHIVLLLMMCGAWLGLKYEEWQVRRTKKRMLREIEAND